MARERDRGWQTDHVRRSFDIIHRGDPEVPPVVVDAVRQMARNLSNIEAANLGAAASTIRKKIKAKPTTGQNAKVAAGAGLSVGGIREVIDFVFENAWGTQASIMAFWDLSLIDGGITALITFCLTMIARQAK